VVVIPYGVVAMIADPININHTSFHLLCLNNVGTDNFFLFRAQHYLDEFEFIINGTVCSGENWLYKMRIDYPDHFDWFLFHPEYFS